MYVLKREQYSKMGLMETVKQMKQQGTTINKPGNENYYGAYA